MARLNYYLAQIGAVASPECDCGHAKETVEHFVLHCRKWTSYRKDVLDYTQNRRGSISFLLGGKTRSDDEKWTPDVEVVQATINFAMAAGRLQLTVREASSSTQ